MRTMHAYVVAATLMLPAMLVQAKEFTVMGEAAVAVTSGNARDIQTRATRAAKRKAVIAAIDQVLGPDASLNPKVAPKIDAVLAQVPDTAVVERKADRVENNYQVTLRLVLDDKTFRTLLSDQGIAINTTTNRGSSLLAIMDEFVATPRDLKAPLEELTEYRSSVGDSLRDKSSAASASSSKDAEASRSTSSAAVMTGRGVGAAERRTDRAAVSRTDSAEAVQVDVKAESHNDQYFRKLVRYQPQNAKAEKVDKTYNALKGQLQDYDLRMIDNDMFRSRYFAGPITLEEMTNSDALAKYVGFARAEAKADFFMVGNSVIIDSGNNPNTGESMCSGLLTVKTYSTQSGEDIASEAVSEVASGMNPNACSDNLSLKLARVAGAHVGARVQNYWKRRLTYGREYVLTLHGAGMTLATRTAFAKAVKTLPGIENSTQRASDSSLIELTVTYKGKDPIDQAVAEGLSGNASFATLDAVSEGTHINFCLGPCGGQR